MSTGKPSPFGRKLRSLRLRLGLTCKETGRLLGVKGPRVSEWERGVRTPKALTQVAIMGRMRKAKETKGR